MLTAQLISATDLHDRSFRLAERGLFPELIRRLILASDSSVRWLHFRGHEGTAIEGWDGSIDQANGAAPYVPAGPSRWELGTNKNAPSKIKSDFEKRNAAPVVKAKKGRKPKAVPGAVPEPEAPIAIPVPLLPSVDRSKTSLVFVVARRWSEKEEWARKQTADTEWKEVHVIDADDLETWLQEYPAVHIWLSVQLSTYVNGALDLNTWWLDWAHQTSPVIQPTWMLAGRSAVHSRITNWLNGNDDTLSVFASTSDEARAVIAASILLLPEQEREAIITHTIVVSDEVIWQQLVRYQKKLLLIPDFESNKFSQLVAAATRNGHRVILGRPATTATPDDKVVPPLNREELQKELQDFGLQSLDAGEKASLARRSFTAFHRTLLKDRTLQELWWMEPTMAQSLLPFLLLNRWNDQFAGDCQIVEFLTGKAYAEVEQQLLEWSQRPQSPLRKLQNEWFILDPADVWEQTAPFISSAVLNRCGEAIQHVLGLPLARFELPANERLWANLRGVYDDYSATLRQGFTITLALLNTHPHPNASVLNVPTWVHTQVKTLLENAIKEPNGHLLASLDNHLPALAEAAPDAFLSTILRDLGHPETVLLRLFDEEEGLTHRTAHHTGLLWALESLAWPPQYISDAALALAALARLDPGGQLSNRPINSLRTIFLGWLPQTNATVVERLAVIDRIRRAEPDVSWRLLILLLPTSDGTSFGSHIPTFHWRDWEVNPYRRPNRKEQDEFIEGITERLLIDIGSDPRRWGQLIAKLPDLLDHLPDIKLRERVLAQLLQIAALPISETDRLVLLQTLREFLNRHRSFPELRWSWNEEKLAPVDSLYQQLQPDSLVTRNAWMFTQWPKLPEGIERRRYDDSEAFILQQQNQVLNELLEAEGLSGIGKLFPYLEDTFWLGYVCGQTSHITIPEKLQLFQQYAALGKEKEVRFAQGLAASFTLSIGEEEVISIAREQQPHWKSEQVAWWLASLPLTAASWQAAHELGEEVENRFWQLARQYVQNDAEALEAVRLFLAHQRPAAAAHVLIMLQHHNHERMPIELVLQTLDALLEAQIKSGRAQVPRYELDSLLDELDHAPDEHRAQAIELAFLFSPASTLSNPKLINNELQRNPAFFVELLAARYKQDGDVEEDFEALSEKEKQYRQAVSERAWSILHNWKSVPGIQVDRKLDCQYLAGWIAEAKKLATERKVTTGLDIELGYLLSHTPAAVNTKPEIDKDGVEVNDDNKAENGNNDDLEEEAADIWPLPCVCELIEAEANNETLLQHVRVGRYNLHGQTHLVDGGNREEQLAADYARWSQCLQGQYSVTARLLRELHEEFANMAKHERQRTERTEQFGM